MLSTDLLIPTSPFHLGRTERLVKYARWHLEYDLMEPVARFLLQLRNALDSGVRAADIAFTQGLGKSDYREWARTHLQSKPLQKKVQALLQRLKKHLNNKNVGRWRGLACARVHQRC